MTDKEQSYLTSSSLLTHCIIYFQVFGKSSEQFVPGFGISLMMLQLLLQLPFLNLFLSYIRLQLLIFILKTT